MVIMRSCFKDWQLQERWQSESPWQQSLHLRRLLHDDQKESGLLPVLARLIKQFDRKYQSREHANDLVQCLHVVLRMLKRLGREGQHLCSLWLFVCALASSRMAPVRLLPPVVSMRLARPCSCMRGISTQPIISDCAEAGGFLVQRRTAHRRKSQKSAAAKNPSKMVDAQTESEDLPGSKSADGTGEAEADMPIAGEPEGVAFERLWLGTITLP